MIRITLYKNCILNDGYKNVFSMSPMSVQNPTSPFKNYLNSLAKQIYEIDNVYQDDMTSLNFKLSNEDYSSIYEFNYMKIESVEDNVVTLTRYAFINSITIGNELAKVSYKLDIWHSFAKNIKGINYSLLKGIRVINGSNNIILPEFKYLPINYEGNNIVNLPEENYHEYSQCYIIIQLQYYNKTTYGASSFAGVKYIFINAKGETTNESYDSDGNLTSATITQFNQIRFRDVEPVISRIINSKARKLVSYKQDINSPAVTGEDLHFDIGNIYVIPYTNVDIISLSDNCYGFSMLLSDTGSTPFTHYVVGGRYMEFKEGNQLILYDTKTFNNNYKRKSIGFLNEQIPIINNGTNINANIYLELGEGSFKLFLNIFNNFIDITENFRYYTLFNQANGDVIAQQELAKNYALYSNAIGLVSNIAKGSINLYTTLETFNVQSERAENLEKRGNYNWAQGNKNSAVGYYNQASFIQGSADIGLNASVAGFLVNSVLSMANYFAKREKITAPVYNTSGIIKGNNLGILNARYWLFDILINSDNDKFVKETINNIGYNIFEYVIDYSKLGIDKSAINFITDGIYYNVLQFGIADVYGHFPLNIKKILDEILMNGIKIWYYYDIDYALEHDTYAVG